MSLKTNAGYEDRYTNYLFLLDMIISSEMTGTLGCWYIIEITIRHQYVIMMQCHKCTVPESDTQLSDLLMQAIKSREKVKPYGVSNLIIYSS